MHTVCGTLDRLNICYELYLELDVSMKLWCLLEPSSAQGDSVGLSGLGKALPWIRVSNWRVVKSSIMKRGYLYERVFTSESMNPRPCFYTMKHHLILDLFHVCLL